MAHLDPLIDSSNSVAWPTKSTTAFFSLFIASSMFLPLAKSSAYWIIKKQYPILPHYFRSRELLP
jgi:hypothetical protein